jgi:outer membrane protein
MLLNIGLTGYLPLYTGNRLSSQIKADQYALKAVAEDVRSAEKSVKAQVAAAFLQLLYYKGEASIARQQQEVSQLLQKRARSLFDKGKRPESDVVETEAMVSRDMALLAAAEGDIALAKLELKLLLNLPDTVDFDISEPNDSLEQIPLLQSHDVYTATSASHPKTL